MSTFAERFFEAEKWVAENTAGLRAWQEAAGVSHSYISSLKGRLADNPEASGRRDKMEKLSRALGEVSGGKFGPLWLLTGEGATARPGALSAYPSKEVVLAMAAKLGYHEASLAGLRMASHKGERSGEALDPGEDYWWQELERLEGRAREQLKLRHEAGVFDATEEPM